MTRLSADEFAVGDGDAARRMPNVGDIVRISGAGAGGWQIAQGASQSIIGNFSSFANSPWTQSGAAALDWYSIAASADGTHLAAVAAAVASGTGGIYISTDSGATWTGPNGNSSAPWRSIASSADGTRLVAANASGGIGGIYTNSGTTWTALVGHVGSNWFPSASSADGSKAGGGHQQLPAAAFTLRPIPARHGRNNGRRRPEIGISVASSAEWQQTCSRRFMAAAFILPPIWATRPPARTTEIWTSVASSGRRQQAGGAVVSGGGIYTSGEFRRDMDGQTSAPVANWQSIASSADGGKLAAVANAGRNLSFDQRRRNVDANNPTNGAIWSCIASSSDGSKLAATVYGGGIYHSQASPQTATTTGTNGYISGIQGSAVELQYIGNNQFMPVSSAGTIWAR